MQNTQSQVNLLIPLDTETERTLRARKRMVNKKAHAELILN